MFVNCTVSLHEDSLWCLVTTSSCSDLGNLFMFFISNVPFLANFTSPTMRKRYRYSYRYYHGSLEPVYI